eukprot:CFRG1716T1
MNVRQIQLDSSVICAPKYDMQKCTNVQDYTSRAGECSLGQYIIGTCLSTLYIGALQLESPVAALCVGVVAASVGVYSECIYRRVQSKEDRIPTRAHAERTHHYYGGEFCTTANF